MDYVCAGYVLCRVIASPVWADGSRSPVLPERIVTACSCLAPLLPAPWMLSWALPDEDAARAFGLTREAVQPWADERFAANDIGWPDLFTNLATAREMVARYGIADAVVLGLAVHGRHVPALLEVGAERREDVGRPALFDALERGLAPEPGGQVLGFELRASSSVGLECSWLCNRLETAIATTLGPLGLIADEGDAERAADFVARPDVGAEPGLWLPWQVLRYP